MIAHAAEFAAPKHQAATRTAEASDLDKLDQQRAATPHRTGQAFCELIEAYTHTDAPRSGGLSATAVVHIAYDTLLGGLDLGRRTRLFTEKQRLAKNIQNPTCQAATCDWPSAMAHLHHLTPWSSGGPTDLKNAVVLFPKHHTLIHHHDYAHHIRADGTITLHRRA